MNGDQSTVVLDVPVSETSVRKENEKNNLGYIAIKRLFDFLCSMIALVLLMPLFLIVAILIKVEDGGPILHRRICVGKNNKPYIMYKFRTMMLDADNRLDLFTPQQREDYLQGVKIKDDPRVTRIGKMLFQC